MQNSKRKNSNKLTAQRLQYSPSKSIPTAETNDETGLPPESPQTINSQIVDDSRGDSLDLLHSSINEETPEAEEKPRKPTKTKTKTKKTRRKNASTVLEESSSIKTEKYSHSKGKEKAGTSSSKNAARYQ